ncbi:MAG: DUF445 family protein [Sandaracinaceae bacterium]|nr:DUF445 family protein [Sandaracinaceae bacterium]
MTTDAPIPQAPAAGSPAASTGAGGAPARKGEPPYLARWRLATGLLVLAAIACVTVALLQGHGVLPHALWVAVLLHGLEGALVGGLCDWFAVVKTYRTVELHRDDVADGIGDWVRDELLSEHVIRKQVDAVLDSPATRDALYARLDKELGSRDELVAKVEGVVASIEKRIVPEAVAFELGDFGTTRVDDVTRDARMEPVFRTCLAEAVLVVLDQPESAEVIDAALKQYVGIFRSLGIAKKERIVQELKEAAVQFRDDSLPSADNVLVKALEKRTDFLLSTGVAAYLHAWDALTELERRNAIAALLERARPVVVTAVTAWIEAQRDELRRMPTLKDYEIAVSVRNLLVERIDQSVSDGVGNAVRESLKEQPASDFRAMLEWQTRRQLEMIRLSGTLMGVAVGAGLGGLLHLLGG